MIAQGSYLKQEVTTERKGANILSYLPLSFFSIKKKNSDIFTNE